MPEIEFLRPKSITEAVALLSAREGARCIAGGQTLVAMLNAGLVEAPSLISIAGIAELNRIERRTDGSVHIGAGVCHREVAAHAALSGAHGVIREAAAVIAHPAIRNFGTMGGSLAHGDPASDYPTAAVAAGASIELVGPAGRRTLAASDFFLDYLMTALELGEIVTALVLPPAAAGSVGHYLKFSRVDGDYAIVSIGVTLTVKDGICAAARLAAGGIGPMPVRSDEADAALVGTECDDTALATAARQLLDRADPVDDVRASAAYRRAVFPKLLRRAVRSAMQSHSAGAGT